jgi:predicted unusual protein kinase regulating ubiquinone biosynthesis (AarF/ABC1/UbiB family)
LKTQERIPKTRIERAAHIAGAGVKVGGNYLKHYAKKLVNADVSREELHKDNAGDIYETLSTLKGSALKVAQMMSMDRGILPREYQEKFQLSQYSAPPLSAPLVNQIFRKAFGQPPSAFFDEFTSKAVAAASIGQVHKARSKDKWLAVKIQYPGVANSIGSDLRMVKPFAVRLLNMSKNDIDNYFDEIEGKLLEETNYALELKRSIELSAACAHIENLNFPTYYPEWSSDKIITMDWLEGLHLKEFLATNPSQEVRNRIGQALWDFYDFQIHELKTVHADPHPGNFLFLNDGTVNIFDFGCVKEIPDRFYTPYFRLVDRNIYKDREKSLAIFKELELLHDDDTEADIVFFTPLFREMIDMLTLPFTQDTFDFGNEQYFGGIYQFADKLIEMPEVRNSKKARGSRHSLYINRTYYGLYHILFDLKAVVNTGGRKFY